MRLITVAALAVVLAACAGRPASLPSPTGSAAPSIAVTTTASPIATPKLEIPLLLLDVRAGADTSRPGTIPPAPGGGTTRGPETLAVDEAGIVWLYDQAKARVVGYENGRFSRAVAVPDVPRGASALLVAKGKLYFRVIDDYGRGFRELEADGITGAVLRHSDVDRGEPSLYPYERVALGWIPTAQKGVDDVLGHDAAGDRYERHYFAQWSAGQCFSVIRRIASNGQDLAEACFDVGSYARDYFLAPDGALYQLEQLYTGAVLDRFVVTRIMAPVK